MTAPLLSVRNLHKTFGKKTAVEDVSFDVCAGEVFGLLGPNGAGKTTTIRMILDIFKPNAGSIEILGGPMTVARRDRIGYMPEERGLYPHMRVLECLVYLGMLKGVRRREARERAMVYLERLELAGQEHEKIGTLSRGMTQKVQVIAAVIHQPELLIIDEPFANLDPVNAQLVREIILELRTEGKAVIMTSHQMGLVESLCDRIAMIDKGQVVLQGTVAAVRRQFAGNVLHLSGSGYFTPPDFISHVDQRTASDWYLSLTPGTDAQMVLKEILAQEHFRLNSFDIALPSLDEIFVRVVRGENGAKPHESNQAVTSSSIQSR